MNNSKMNNVQKSLSNNKGNKPTNNRSNNGSNSIIKSTLNKISPDANSSMRVIIPAVILIISLSVIGVGIYYGYKYYTSFSKNTNGSGDRYQAVSGVVNATNQIDINRSNIPQSQYSNEYSISFWVKIDDYTYKYNEPKVIYRHGDADAPNPEILLAPSDNNLIVRTKLQHNNANSENFKDIRFDNSDPKLSYIPDMQSISDNATGVSNNFDNNIFSLLNSDNAIVTSDKKCPGFIETFATTTTIPSSNIYATDNNLMEDTSTAITNLISQFCTFAKNMQDHKQADNAISLLDTIFDSIIKMLDSWKSNISRENSNMNSVKPDISGLATKLHMNSQSQVLINGMSNDLQSIITLTSKISNENIKTYDQYKAIATLVNNKLKANGTASKCPDLLLSIDAADIVGFNLLEAVIKMIQKTLYIFIHNMGKAVEKVMPELASSSTNKVDIDSCMVRNIPLQKWVSVIVSQYNQNIDIYIDGELASSCVSAGFPAVVDDNAVLCPNGGFSGKLANVILYNTAITVNRAKEIYYAGPSIANNVLSGTPSWVYYILVLLVLIVIVYSIIA